MALNDLDPRPVRFDERRLLNLVDHGWRRHPSLVTDSMARFRGFFRTLTKAEMPPPLVPALLRVLQRVDGNGLTARTPVSRLG